MTTYDTQLRQPMRQVCLRLPSELVEEFSQTAKAEDRTLSAEVRRAMRSYLKKESTSHATGK